MSRKQPWEPGYKPPTAAEVFDESAPLPDDLVRGIAQDYAMQERSNRAEGLEDALQAIVDACKDDEKWPDEDILLDFVLDTALVALEEFRR
jgi:hypothetical protein